MSLKVQLVCSSCGMQAFVMDPVAARRGQPIYTDVHGRPARWVCPCGSSDLTAAKDAWVEEDPQVPANADPNDLFAQWAGSVQRLRKEYEERTYLESRTAFQKGRQSAEKAPTSDWVWKGGRFQPPAQEAVYGGSEEG